MIVKIKKLNDDAIIPSYAKEGDAGMDLTAVSYDYDTKYKNHVYGTGIAVEIPKGYVGFVFPRSSNRKTNAYLCNHVGIIDSGYRGEIILTFKERDDVMLEQMPYEIGDRIGQLMIMPYPFVEFEEVEELSDTERGAGGFGSTGK